MSPQVILLVNQPPMGPTPKTCCSDCSGLTGAFLLVLRSVRFLPCLRLSGESSAQNVECPERITYSASDTKKAEPRPPSSRVRESTLARDKHPRLSRFKPRPDSWSVRNIVPVPGTSLGSKVGAKLAQRDAEVSFVGGEGSESPKRPHIS